MATVDFLFLANHAEVQNGLLYASGVGWFNLYRQLGPEGQLPINHFGIGTSIVVPWGETNQPHHVIVRVEMEDGTMQSEVETDIEVGRPPGLPAGTDQRVVLGLGVDMVFPQQGNYQAVVKVDEDTRSVPFRVHDQRMPQS